MKNYNHEPVLVTAASSGIRLTIAKLTLKLDKQVIDAAKGYASSKKRSLSGIIEACLRRVIDKQKNSTGT